MKPEEFVKTIYLGDRACKKIVIDGWDELLKIQVNEISRIRDVSGQWNYYNDENMALWNNLWVKIVGIAFGDDELCFSNTPQPKPGFLKGQSAL
jgi:hypothetical protein